MEHSSKMPEGLKEASKLFDPNHPDWENKLNAFGIRIYFNDEDLSDYFYYNFNRGLSIRNFSYYSAASYKGGLIHCFPTLIDAWKQKKVPMRVGKFLKLAKPDLTDKELDSFVTQFIKDHKEKEFDLIDSDQESAFIHAYKQEHVKGPFRADMGESYLSSSCMRYSFSNLPKHPASVYASGDFRIIYTVEKESGLIGSRVVVGNNHHSHIYSSDSKASDILIKYLEEKGIKEDKGRKFNGLALQKIPCEGGEYLMPFIDNYDHISDEGAFFEVGGDIEIGSTCGTVSLEETFFCENCENSFSSENRVLTADGNQCWCDYCVNSYTTYSRLMRETIADNIAVPVGNYVATQEWLDDNGYICTVDGEYYRESDCIYIESEGEYYFKDSSDIEEVGGKYYLIYSDEWEEAKEKQEEKERLANEAYETKVTWEYGWGISLDETWLRVQVTPYMGLQKKEETKLRDNYQINKEGIPERLPELPGLIME